ncbi:MAG: hypothetical protein NZ899_00050 [Thermoguttaceae bacterium]|nr:hypothetical protein [Thermoguttaceae bacterium]MDW8077288.1 hypothetical protein [Thermoguttaceae bacterium]
MRSLRGRNLRLAWLLGLAITCMGVATAAFAQSPASGGDQPMPSPGGTYPAVYVDPRCGVAWHGVLFPTPVAQRGACRSGCLLSPLIDPRLLGIYRPTYQPYVAGPPIGTVVYPYYTVRGPRDFLAVNPPSIGP